MYRLIASALFLISTIFVAVAQENPVSAEMIIPKPVKVVQAQGHFTWTQEYSPRVVCPDKALMKELKSAGLKDFAINEAYRLEIKQNGITIRAAKPAGVFYARQTLEQMSRAGSVLACCTVTDWPRFEYRGVMKSMSGIFHPKAYVFQLIDIFSSLKFNVLHMHFTDNKGWRLESASYPRLNTLASWRKSEEYEDRYNFVPEGTPGAYGGYWTRSEVREMVKYAAEHNMQLMPEIEIPGHSQEVLVAYPELRCEDENTGELILSKDLCPGREETYHFLEAQIDEMVELFPYAYIHIGGDEAFKTSWKRCRHCRERMRAEGLETMEELQGYMMKRMCRYVESKGRKPVGWTEIRQGGLPDGVTVTAWFGGRQACDEVLREGHDLICEPASHTYFCYPQNGPYDWSGMPAGWIGYNVSLRDAYQWDPLEGIDASLPGRVLGVEASLWGVYFVTGTDLYKPFEYYFPRTFATAEVAWSQPERDYESFLQRVLPLAERYRKEGIPCFDVRNEKGPRPESLVEVDHVAKDCRIEFRQPWYPGAESSDTTGPEVLVDGHFGGWNVNSSEWLNFKSVDFVIDLGSTQRINEVVLSLHDRGMNLTAGPRFWVELSSDGKQFQRAGEICYEQSIASYSPSWHLHPVFCQAEARFVRICSAAAGENSFGNKSIYIDEIIVR